VRVVLRNKSKSLQINDSGYGDYFYVYHLIFTNMFQLDYFKKNEIQMRGYLQVTETVKHAVYDGRFILICHRKVNVANMSC